MKKFPLILMMVGLLSGSGWFAYSTYAQAEQDCQTYSINSWNGCAPSVETVGLVSSDKYSAVVQAVYNSNGAGYTLFDYPEMGIEYGLARNGDFEYATELVGQQRGVRRHSFLLNGLTEGERYAYRAVLYWVGGVKKGDIIEFTPGPKTLGTGGANNTVDSGTKNTSSSNSTGTTQTNNQSSSNNQNTSSQNSSNSTVTLSPFGNLFGNKNTTTKKSIYSATDEKSGFTLAIDDGVAKVRQGDTVTTKVRYENNNNQSYKNAQIELFFPNEFAVESTNKGMVDRANNKVVVSIDDFPAGSYGTIIATARATGRLGNIDQVLTQSTMTVGSVKLTVTDANEYGEGSGRNRTTSQSRNTGTSTGFLPGTLIGWILLLIVLALVVVIGRRYFIKKDY